MIFNGDDDGMHHMMDWGSYIWIYMIIGMIAFLIIVIILIFLIARLSREDKGLSKSNQKTKQVSVIEEDKKEKATFCPNCGEILPDSKAKYCQSCGSEI